MIKLHLGCGRNIYEDCFNYDCNPLDDRIIDWRAGEILCNPDGLGLDDDSVSDIYCRHMIEHIPHSDPQEKTWFKFWEECWRVMEVNGRMNVTCPHGDSIWAWGDPGHIRAIYPETFVFLCSDNYLNALSNPKDPMTLYFPKCDFLIDINLSKGDASRIDRKHDDFAQMNIILTKKELPEEYERAIK